MTRKPLAFSRHGNGARRQIDSLKGELSTARGTIATVQAENVRLGKKLKTALGFVEVQHRESRENRPIAVSFCLHEFEARAVGMDNLEEVGEVANRAWATAMAEFLESKRGRRAYEAELRRRA